MHVKNIVFKCNTNIKCIDSNLYGYVLSEKKYPEK